MKVTLERSEGPIRIESEPGETILDSLLRASVDVSYCCRAGICGLCASMLVAGEIEPVDPSLDITSSVQLKPGEILICRCRPRTDCVVRQREATWAPSQAARRFVATATAVLGDAVLHLRIASEVEGDALRFRAGQHVHLDAGQATGLPERLFIASRPGLPYLDFYVPFDPLRHPVPAWVQPGAELSIREPIGSASLREDDAQPVVIVAERAGLASALGMIDALAVYQASRPAYLVMRGDEGGVLEHLLAHVADPACLPYALVGGEDELGPAVEHAVRELHDSTHIRTADYRACIKAGAATVRSARAALTHCGVRPWNIHVDTTE